MEPIRKTEPINLTKNKKQITELFSDLCREITDLPKDKRPDDEPRREMRLLIRQMGSKNKNKLFVSICLLEEELINSEKPGEPLKPIQPLADFTALKKESKFSRFPKGIIIKYFGVKYQAIVSGLKPEENLFLAIIMMAHAINIEFSVVLEKAWKYKINMIARSIFTNKSYYLHEIVAREHLAHMDKNRERYIKKV